MEIMCRSYSFPYHRSNSVRPTYVGRYRRALSGIIRAHDRLPSSSQLVLISTVQTLQMSSFESQCSLIFHWRRVFPDHFGGTGFVLPLACEQALCLGKGWKNCEQGEGKGLEFTVNSHYSGHYRDLELERSSYDLEMKTREQDRTTNERKYSDVIGLSNGYKRAWLLVGKQTLGWKNFMPKNVLEINRYFALTSYCDTIDQSINAFSILGFSVEPENEEYMFWSFHPLADKTNN